MSVTVAELRGVIGLDDRPFDRGLDRADERMNRFARDTERKGEEAAERASKALGKIDVGRLGEKLTLGVTLPLLAVGTGAVKTAVDLEALKMALITVAGSSESAERQFLRLREVAKLPGLGFQEAIQGSVNLQAAGLSAEMAERALKAFGNALASTGKGKAELEGVTTALTQIVAKGKVSAEEILQLQERVPQIQKALKDAFGTADTEAIQKMGFSAEEAVGRIITSLEKLPKFVGSNKAEFENFADEVQDSAAALGRDLLPVAKDAMEVGREMLQAWKALPPEFKENALRVGLFSIAAGPVLKLLGGIGDGIKFIASLKDIAVGAWGAKAAAVTLHTRALDLNTAAAARNAAAALGGGPALGGGARLLGKAGPVLAGAAAVAGGFWLGTEIEKAWDPWGRHREQRRIDGLQASASRQKAAADAEIERRIAAGEAHWEGGRLRPGPGSGGGPAAAVADPKDLAKARSAQHEAELEAARNAAAGSPEERRARAEAARLIPLLEKRGSEIRAELAQAKQGSESYWKLTREGRQLEGDIQQLRQAAAKEASDEAKKRRQEAQETRNAFFQASKEQAAALAAQAPEGFGSRAQAGNVIPVLVGRLQELVSQAAVTRAGSGEYARISSEYWQIRGEIGQLQKAATAEEREQIQRAAQQAQANAEASFNAQVEAAKAWGETAHEGARAQATAQALIPVLRREQARLVDAIRKTQPDSAEFHRLRAQGWKLEKEILDAEQAGRQEQRDAAQKALDQAKKARHEQQEILGLRVSLAGAQIANNPWLNDRQKKQALAGFQAQQSAELLRPVEGESETERLRRLIEANQLAGTAVENQLGGRRNPRMAAYLFGEIERMSQQGRSLGVSGGGGAPNLTLQLNAPSQLDGAVYAQILQDPRFQKALWQLVERFRFEDMQGQGYPRAAALP